MNITDEQVRQALYTFVCRAISNSFTAVVEDNSKAESQGFVKVVYNDLKYNVKLQALTDATSQGLVQIPKVGSQLFCVNEGNSSGRFVAAAYTEIEKVIFKQGDNSVTVTEESIDLMWKENSIVANEAGITLKRGDNSIELSDKSEGGIKFNGGGLGGLVVLEALKDQLNNIEKAYNDFVDKYNDFTAEYRSHIHASSAPGVATGPAVQSVPSVPVEEVPDSDPKKVTPTQAIDIENTKITQ